jgi:hypothetical protein
MVVSITISACALHAQNIIRDLRHGKSIHLNPIMAHAFGLWLPEDLGVGVVAAAEDQCMVETGVESDADFAQSHRLRPGEVDFSTRFG